MKFFESIPLSSSPLENLALLDDAPDILEPSHRLYCHYSIHQSLLPRNVVPNTASLFLEILAVATLMSDLLASLPGRLCSVKVNIPHACVHGLYLQRPSISLHSLNHISESTNLCNELEGRPLIHGSDISSPKQYEHLTCLLYVNSFDSLPFSKSKKFLETKVAAMKLRGFNHS